MDILKTLFIAILPVLLTGCFTEFDPGVNNEEKLCISSLVTAGDSIKVEVTHTWTWNDADAANSSLGVFDADVRLFVNDEFKETLELKLFTIGIISATHPPYYYRYVAQYIPSPGDRIRIEASSKDYGDAWGEVTVPQPPELDGVNALITNPEYDSEGNVWKFSLALTMGVTDDSGSTDFYKYSSLGSVKTEEAKEGNFSFHTLDATVEPLFTEHVSALESVISETSGYVFFTDRQISGTTYPLHLLYKNAEYRGSLEAGNPAGIDQPLYLSLAAISKSYYDHVISVWVAEDGIAGSLGSVGLGDPVYPASNVSTGAGVIAAQTYSYIEFTIGDLLREAIAAE
jgi:hypothetical protein